MSTIRDGKPGEIWRVETRHGTWARWKIIDRALASSRGFTEGLCAVCIQTGNGSRKNELIEEQYDDIAYIDDAFFAGKGHQWTKETQWAKLGDPNYRTMAVAELKGIGFFGTAATLEDAITTPEKIAAHLVNLWTQDGGTTESVHYPAIEILKRFA